jgi:hypothetical protein
MEVITHPLHSGGDSSQRVIQFATRDVRGTEDSDGRTVEIGHERSFGYSTWVWWETGDDDEITGEDLTASICKRPQPRSHLLGC